jgi:hypothetical protein
LQSESVAGPYRRQVPAEGAIGWAYSAIGVGPSNGSLDDASLTVCGASVVGEIPRLEALEVEHFVHAGFVNSHSGASHEKGGLFASVLILSEQAQLVADEVILRVLLTAAKAFFDRSGH